MNCRTHPEKPATYHCVGCKNDFCDDCVSIRKITSDFTAYICKNCGGKCDSLAEAEENAKKQSKPIFFGPKHLKDKQIEERLIRPPKAKKERRPLSTNFWASLWGVVLFPTKWWGMILVLLHAGLLYVLMDLLERSPFFQFILWPVFITYFAVFLLKIIEDSLGGSRGLEGVNLTYWLGVSRPLIYVAAALIICLGTANIYFFLLKKVDFIYFTLLIVGGFFTPMFLIRIAVLRQLDAINPFKVLISIRKTFFAYLITYILLAVFKFLIYYINMDILTDYQNSESAAYVVFVYALFAGMRLLGVFARCYQKRIIEIG